MGVVVAIDAGTTGVRSFAVDEAGRPVAWSYREFPQYFPRPGWVEHDATEIWEAVRATLADVAAQVRETLGQAVAAIGITNQRETVVVWDRRTGEPLHRALVWQDRRTAAYCDEVRAAGHEATIREQTGLVVDPYFSATKLRWMFTEAGLDRSHPGLAFGTVDAWILFKLTGGDVHATDVTNASRTLLYDIRRAQWSDDLLRLFDIPATCLPEVRPSSGRFGTVAAGVVDGLDSVPISGIAGDQQAALFGQACFTPGMTKNTYGTGSFVLMNVGETCPEPTEGLLTTVAWQLDGQPVTYALEGAIFVTGAAIQWMRDGINIIDAADETGPLAASVSSSDGVVFVPAFTGLGSPWWDPYARGLLIGLSRGIGRAHVARAVVEAMAFQTRDVVEAMAGASGTGVTAMRADGGASVMDVLLQIQADQLQVPVARPKIQETTALGAAYLAGLAEGVWSSPDDVTAQWALDAEFTPKAAPATADRAHAQWRRALDRSRGWASAGQEASDS